MERASAAWLSRAVDDRVIQEQPGHSAWRWTQTKGASQPLRPSRGPLPPSVQALACFIELTNLYHDLETSVSTVIFTSMHVVLMIYHAELFFSMAGACYERNFLVGHACCPYEMHPKKIKYLGSLSLLDFQSAYSKLYSCLFC